MLDVLHSLIDSAIVRTQQFISLNNWINYYIVDMHIRRIPFNKVFIFSPRQKLNLGWCFNQNTSFIRENSINPKIVKLPLALF